MATEPTRMATKDTREQFAAVIEDVAFRGKRVIVTSHGRDRCALVSMDDLRQLEELDAGKRPAKTGRK